MKVRYGTWELLIFNNFQNDVTLQPLDEFLCSTPEMKARDPYVPFLMSKRIFILQTMMITVLVYDLLNDIFVLSSLKNEIISVIRMSSSFKSFVQRCFPVSRLVPAACQSEGLLVDIALC